MLGIDPKTLRNWMRRATMLFTAHPTDARLNCLTQTQVQQLATLHGRPLPSSASTIPALREEVPLLGSSLGQATPSQECAATPAQETLPFPPSVPEEVDLRKTLASLETKVTTMQEQLAQLALELLRERGLRYEQRLSALEAVVQQTMGLSPTPFQG